MGAGTSSNTELSPFAVGFLGFAVAAFIASGSFLVYAKRLNLSAEATIQETNVNAMKGPDILVREAADR